MDTQALTRRIIWLGGKGPLPSDLFANAICINFNSIITVSRSDLWIPQFQVCLLYVHKSSELSRAAPNIEHILLSIPQQRDRCEIFPVYHISLNKTVLKNTCIKGALLLNQVLLFPEKN